MKKRINHIFNIFIIGGFKIRWLIPWLILFPLILNFLAFQGYKLGWYSLNVAYSIEPPFTIFSLLIIVSWNAYFLEKIERERRLIDQKFQDTEEEFKQAVEAAELGTWRWNLVTEKVKLSPQCERLLGLNPGEFGGTYQDFIKLLQDEDLNSLNKSLKIAKLNHSRWIMDYRIIDLNNNERWLVSTGKFLYDENGEAREMMGIVKDVTYRKQIEFELRHLNETLENRVMERTAELNEANNLLQDQLIQRHQIEAELQKYADEITDLYNNAPCGYHSLDSNGFFIKINDTELNWLGYTREQIINKMTILDLITPESRQIVKQNFESFKQRGWVNNLELEMIRSDGTLLSVILSATAIKDGKNNFIMSRSTIFDITKRKQGELELQKAKEMAEFANQSKSIFLANMTHELRTPLNAILGFTQILARDNSLNSYHQERLEIINRSGEHLLGLIDDILDLSKIETGQLTLNITDCDLHLLLVSLEEMLTNKADSKGLNLFINTDAHLPRYIKTDEKKLRQVLINLLNNAIKFTNQGHVILQVSSSPLNQETDKNNPNFDYDLHFTVEDTGVGIAAEEIDSLFQIFVQAEAGKKLNQGSGLGLAISQKIVQLMGGEIEVQSVFGQGTIFSFTIKIKSASPPLIPTENLTQKVIGLAPGQPLYRLLVVEDIWESRRLLVELLQAIGFDVKEATNGAEALAICETWSPHLIWLDIKMPIMNGYEPTQRIKQSKLVAKPVIIALTASVSEEQRDSILAAGCDDLVSKPFPEALIFTKIAQYLGVKYVYETPSPPQPSLAVADLSKEALAVMSLEWIKQMYQAAYCLDEEEMLELIAQIPHSEVTLANILKDLVINFNTDLIMQLTHSLLLESSDSLT